MKIKYFCDISGQGLVCKWYNNPLVDDSQNPKVFPFSFLESIPKATDQPNKKKVVNENDFNMSSVSNTRLSTNLVYKLHPKMLFLGKERKNTKNMAALFPFKLETRYHHQFEIIKKCTQSTDDRNTPGNKKWKASQNHFYHSILFYTFCCCCCC